MTVRLLFDQNVSPKLALALSDLYPDSLHVTEAGLDSAPDEQIWRFAGDKGLIIVTKDRDFREFSLDLGAPPKLIWVLRTSSVAKLFASRSSPKTPVRLCLF